MIEFTLTKDLAKPLSRFIKPAKKVQADLTWKGDIALIGSQPCVVMQELNSHYIMVFCDVRKGDFTHFPNFFRQRFWREAAAICKQANLYDTQLLINQLTLLCEEQHYQLDRDDQEEGPITKVMEKLERLFLYEKQPLPVDGKSAFEFSFQMNTRRPKTKQIENPESPAEALGNLCLNLIEQNIQREKQKPQLIHTISDNVVTVNFAQRRKDR